MGTNPPCAASSRGGIAVSRRAANVAAAIHDKLHHFQVSSLRSQHQDGCAVGPGQVGAAFLNCASQSCVVLGIYSGRGRGEPRIDRRSFLRTDWRAKRPTSNECEKNRQNQNSYV